MSNDTSPSIAKTAFSCPHCEAFTSQYWNSLFSRRNSSDYKTPIIPDQDYVQNLRKEIATGESSPELSQILDWAKKMLTNKPFISDTNEKYNFSELNNCFASQCFNCEEFTLWIGDKMIYPNPDMPEKVKGLFEEAREIVNSSPKGAAALLRLCIQYLLIDLGESGKNIAKDIGSLVEKGLNPLIQKSLDVVRVIGNESVHPGEIDLNDNKDIALKLFTLVNIICDQMITHPKEVENLYSNLPQNKIEAIDSRDKKSTK
jgi:hypothetical protein